MPNHQTLKAWQHGQRFAVECVKAAQAFPECEQAALADQLRRACYSVPLNIAEGIARDVGYLRPAEFGRLEALATETSKTLFGLMREIGQSVEKSPKPR